MAGPDRSRVREVFGEAVELLPAERRAFLERACGGDSALREQVESLLDALGRAGEYLGSPSLGGPTIGRLTSPGEKPGAVIGRYRLLEPIGEGGFGVVFLAEQREPVVRKVALKVIKRGMDTRAVIARFEAEQQALAMMDHPNIAKVLDAGATEAGRPYFAMELVRGVPITRFCDDERLVVRERLALFIDACRAVQHAHQKGIIHRDLKPSNVLVSRFDDKPVVKVIDFGIAKATGGAAGLTDKTLFTEFRQLIGTPAYMSPEQAGLSDLDIDTRSDIYALGVLLYELMTGTTPFDAARLGSAGFDEMRRIIREEEPPRPSTRLSQSLQVQGATPGPESLGRGIPDSAASASCRRTDARSLARSLQGDLDWIAMKALEKDRTRRYDSATGLAQDVERYLKHEPVLAGPPGRVYRVRKFVRRNRGLVTGAALVGAALLAGIAGTTYGLVQAEQRAGETQRVSDFQGAMLGEIKVEAMGRGINDAFREQVRSALERGYVGEFPDRRKRTPEEIEAEVAAFDERAAAARTTDVARRVMEEFVLAHAADAMEKGFADQPLVRARLHSAIGKAYQALGSYDSAVQHLRAALEIRQGEAGMDDAMTLVSIGDMGLVLQDQGTPAEAEPYLREALKRRRRMLGDQHPDTLRSINNLGTALQAMGKRDEAEPYLREALTGRRRVLGDDDPSTLISIGNMGSLLVEKGEPGKAEPFQREALERQRRVLGDDHPGTLIAIDNMGGTLYAQGRFAEAEPCYREALEVSRRLLGSDHPHTLRRINNLGGAIEALGRVDEAERLYREAMEGCLRVLGDDHPVTLSAIGNLGSALWRLRRLAEAEPYYRAALEGRGRVLGPEHQETLIAVNNMGSLLRNQGKPAEALAHFEAGTRVARAALRSHPTTAMIEHHHADVLRKFGRLDEAIDLAQAAVDRYRAHPDWSPGEAAHARQVLAATLHAAGRPADALAVSWESIQAARRRPGASPTAVASALATFGREATAAGDPASLERAEEALRECLAIRETVLEPDSSDYWHLANARGLLGSVLAAQGAALLESDGGAAIAKFTEAEPMLVEAARWLSQNADRVPQEVRAERVRQSLERIVRLYEAWEPVSPGSGKADRAAAWRAELESLPGP